MHTYCRLLKMKSTWMMLLLGSSLAGTCSGWTYHHSSTTMNWSQARQWCRNTYTDMVVIQNQDENDKLVSVLPNKTSSPYYWLGLTRTREDWTWVGNNSTWMGEESWAENEPNNNKSVTVCVEIYVNNGDNRGKWNDEKCRQKKYAVCYQAQCNDTICGPGRCREVANNFTCLCDADLQGNTSHTAEQTPNDTVLAGTSFPSTSQSEQTPKDTVLAGTSFPSTSQSVHCTHLSHPDGYLSCAEGNHTVNSTCRFKCHRGFLMIGSPEVTCGATGVWSSPGPTCALIRNSPSV
ncbi:L-selectin-like isoform X2 [Entelurus aequoreus]|uniref:L-selectin-like isoform X2 n=1 Tax=Entelurus aequoreus TaxID=161455 RepID=UPI002B1E54E7|nr:L-selectin-like isoform X2 [Entelurus aequoreus]